MVQTGCWSRAYKEAKGGVLGADSGVAPLTSLSPTTFNAYGTYELGSLENDAGTLVPLEFPSLFRSQLRKRLADKGLAAGPGQPATIDVTILHYDTAKLIGQAFGPFEEVVARVTIVDRSTGRVLARANCIGRSESTTSQGPEPKAAALAEAIVDLIADHRKTGD